MSVLIQTEERQRVSQGISPSDLQAVQEKFEQLGLDFDSHVFRYCRLCGHWKVFSVETLEADDEIGNSETGW